MTEDTIEVKKSSIMDHGKDFLDRLTERCLTECSKVLIPFGVPVFKKFLKYRTQRELELNREALDTAEVLHSTGTNLSYEDIDELLQTSRFIDKKLQRDIFLLPIRINFNYEKVLPIRKRRLEILTTYFKMLLDTCQMTYKEMVRRALSKKDYIDINSDVVELYAEEAYEVNLCIKSPVKIDLEQMAQRIHCSMIEVGMNILRQEAEEIYS
jgi:hypothetical protein